MCVCLLGFSFLFWCVCEWGGGGGVPCHMPSFFCGVGGGYLHFWRVAADMQGAYRGRMKIVPR